MPVLDGSTFQPIGKYRNGHYNTIATNLYSRSPDLPFKRSRVITSDNDFLDLDYLISGSKKLAVLCHGLEGSSDSGYILRVADHLHHLGWDILALNYRGCSGEMNRNLQMYNSGSTGDLHEAINHRIKEYDQLALVGFSLGGNIVLKYIGDGRYDISSKIKVVVAVSTPIHLSDASQQLLKAENTLYQIRFVKSLSSKVLKKKKQFPDDIQRRHLLKCYNLYKFDDLYTAPLFGYKNAEEYYAKNQAIQWLEDIQVPSLIINAQDDPFLGPLCYPNELVNRLDDVFLMVPEFGGHVGFSTSKHDRSWLQNEISNFIISYTQDDKH